MWKPTESCKSDGMGGICSALSVALLIVSVDSVTRLREYSPAGKKTKQFHLINQIFVSS
jgi:hypothetical protein